MSEEEDNDAFHGLVPTLPVTLLRAPGGLPLGLHGTVFPFLNEGHTVGSSSAAG